MEENTEELIAKGHGVRHYTCGHTTRCRCKHGNSININVDSICYDCQQGATKPLDEKAPPGWKGTVKAMKKHKEISNPFALSWWMKNRGAESHYKNSDQNPPVKRYKEWLKTKDYQLYKEVFNKKD